MDSVRSASGGSASGGSVRFRDRSFEARSEEASRIRARYTDRVPCIVERSSARGTSIAALDKAKVSGGARCLCNRGSSQGLSGWMRAYEDRGSRCRPFQTLSALRWGAGRGAACRVWAPH